MRLEHKDVQAKVDAFFRAHETTHAALVNACGGDPSQLRARMDAMRVARADLVRALEATYAVMLEEVVGWCADEIKNGAKHGPA